MRNKFNVFIGRILICPDQRGGLAYDYDLNTFTIKIG